jgi:hypothetical protein
LIWVLRNGLFLAGVEAALRGIEDERSTKRVETNVHG